MRERLARKPPGYRFTIGRILAIYAGLMVALLLAALDQTIVATALPKVVSDLGGLSQYSWVFTAPEPSKAPTRRRRRRPCGLCPCGRPTPRLGS